MELPFAVASTSSGTNAGTAAAAAGVTSSSTSSLFHPSSNASSLVSASSSQASLGKSNNENILYSNHQHHNNTTSTNMMMMQMMSSNVAGFNPYHHHNNNNNTSGNLLHPQSVVLSSSPSINATSSSSSPPPAFDTETIDFTYVTVCEEDADEVDIVLDGGDDDNDDLLLSPEQRQHQQQQQQQRQRESPQGDVLTVLLSGAAAAQTSDAIVRQCEDAHVAANQAIVAKKEANLNEALEAHARAAKLFKEAAVGVRETNISLSNSLLLLSQNQAKAALVLKRILKQRPTELQQTTPAAVRGGVGGGATAISSDMSQKERLRAAVRGAMGQKKEADMSDSVFLGRASSSPSTSLTSSKITTVDRSESKSKTLDSNNPVDDMMELERELREMDMALELGNSIASLDARTMQRMKNATIDGSFMMVAPGQSYMSSSALWSSGMAANNPSRPTTNAPVGGTATARARANHVQNVLQASSAGIPAMISHPPATNLSHHHSQQHALQQSHHSSTAAPSSQNKPASGLESSWWGNASTTSQVLASSVISLSSRVGGDGMLSPAAHHHHNHQQQNQHQQQPANTKQLMRLLDSLKTLGDENAALLREVEEAEAARMEAKAAREQMKRFKAEYGQRFAALKAALEKFRKGYPENTATTTSGNTVNSSSSNNNNNGKNGNAPNPVTTSDFFRTASATEQLQRQEQLIRKLTEDLKKEKSESRKKDAALRKYESFYREVKARSAQKAAQRQQGMQPQQQQQPQNGSPQPQRRPPNPR